MGQLAVDLVISAISPAGRHIGYFYDSCILPVVGNDAFTQSADSLGKLNVSVEGLLHFFLVLSCSTSLPVTENNLVNRLFRCLMMYVCKLKTCIT